MKLQVGDISLAYDDLGPRTGRPIVFIHGFPFNRETWKAQVEALRADFRVITYDVRGHGESTAGDRQFTIEYFVDDLIALLDHLKIASVVGIGLSMGGYILLRAVERHPERFRALVLCDTRSEPDNNEGKVRRINQAKVVKSEGMKKFADEFLRMVFYHKTHESNPAAVESIRRIVEAADPLNVAATLIALAARTDTTPALYNIRVPTLIMVGQHDTVTPPSAAHDMKQKVPYAALHVIRKAGHLSNVENPGEFNERLLAFLGRLLSGSESRP